MAPAARATPLLLVIASMALIVAATTMPWSAFYVGHSHWARVEWVPFSQRVRPLDFVLNVLLFVPFGVSACMFGADRARPRLASGVVPHGPVRGVLVAHRIHIVVFAAVVLSMGVEVFQVYTHGRLPTTTDILGNALGALIGARWAAARIARGDGT